MQLATSRPLTAERLSSRNAAGLATPGLTRAGSRLCRAGAHKFPGFLGKIVSSGGKGKDKHAGHGHGHGHGQDEPSGMWQSQGHHWHEAGSEVAAPRHLDGPAGDYLALHPPPQEDDPFHPDLPPGADAATAAVVLGPDMHGSLEPWPGGRHEAGSMGGGVGARAGAVPTRFVISGATGGGGGDSAGRHAAMLAQLRERALGGSSDEDESWRRMDIPGLLLSPHHAAAMQSLSSASDSDDGLDGGRRGAWGGLLAPDFADLTLAREADAAAAAAAELVPPELRPLARAANILGVHRAARRGGGGGAAAAGGSGSAASGDASGSEAPELWAMEANRFLGLPEEPLTPQQLEAAAALLLGNISPAGGLHASWCVAGNVSTGSDADADTSSDADPGSATATAADAALIGGNTVAQGATQRRGGAASRGSSSSLTSNAQAAAVAAVSEEGIDWLAGPVAAAGAATGSNSALEESRSVQLRRSPGHGAAAAGLDAAARSRVAAAVAGDAADADAHVVRGSSHHGSSTPSAEEKRQQQQCYSLARGVAGAAGELAADAAAAAVVAEARRAVWGEAGWPHAAAVRSTDVAEELKHDIQQQQEAVEHGAAPLGLP
ncbi:hypothetical protein HXX76_000801 [Chlamydomonas incerta]|uniref:Uncharacterized protein n=1 Tax=Chlamydomonas incerta TaxID=51695 RepID=A0A835WFA3_CHLIN|nr:hypothetical protein HXX76_000801 [Chlamydomonas incerta]|eukprot:KAG2446209.1 hypothetical protein HXX76_000801 [Chlamydomonas incerta]